MAKCTVIHLDCTAMVLGAAGGQEADSRSRGTSGKAQTGRDSRSRSRDKAGNANEVSGSARELQKPTTYPTACVAVLGMGGTGRT